MKHLEKTGYDDTGVMVVREFNREKEKRMRKFGSFEQSVIDYPDIVDGKKSFVDVISHVDDNKKRSCDGKLFFGILNFKFVC